MRSRVIAALLIAALTLVGGIVVAQRGRGGPGQGMGMGMGNRAAGGPCGLGLGLGLGPAAVGELALTSAQTTKLQAITNQFVSDTQRSRAQLQTMLDELAQLWTAEKPNESAIRNKIADVDRVRTQIRNSMVDRTFAVMRVLTPQQKAKLRGLVKSRPGFGVGVGCGLGLGCDVSGGGCYMMNGAGGQGYRGGRGK